ncbi:MAG: hypothetical protein ABH803_01255 [Candidatus Micrarchaeota archaeon]
MKKLFLFLLLVGFVSGVEQDAMLVSFHFQGGSLLFEEAEFGLAEVPNYYLNPEHPLFLRFYVGSIVVKELEVSDPRFYSFETVENGSIENHFSFLDEADLHLVLPVVTGSCVLRVFDLNETELMTFNSCSLKPVQNQGLFYSYSTLQARTFDYAILVISFLMSLVLIAVILKRLRT